jgi:hypothetical protein
MQVQVTLSINEHGDVTVDILSKQTVSFVISAFSAQIYRPYTISADVSLPLSVTVPTLYHDPLCPLTPDKSLSHLLASAWGFSLLGQTPSFNFDINMFEIDQTVLLYLREQLSTNSLLIFTPTFLSVKSEKDPIYVVKLVLLFTQNVISFNIYQTNIETLRKDLKTFITSPEGSIKLVDGKLTLPVENIISSRRNYDATKKKQNDFGIIFPELGPMCAALDDDEQAWSLQNPGRLFWNPYFNAAIEKISDNVFSFCAYLRQVAATFSYPVIVQLDMDNNLLQTHDDAANGLQKKQTIQQRRVNNTRYDHMSPDAVSAQYLKVHFRVEGYMIIRNEKNARYNMKLHEKYSYDVMVCYCSEMILRTCYEIGAKVFIHTWGDRSYAENMIRHANERGWKSEDLSEKTFRPP